MPICLPSIAPPLAIASPKIRSLIPRSYRQAIDAVWDKVLKERGESNVNRHRILSSPDEVVSRSDLTHVFARGQDENHDGLTPGFFEGPRHQRLVRGRSPRHRGMHVGRVVSSNGGALTIRLDGRYTAEDVPLKRGDGLVVDRGVSCSAYARHVVTYCKMQCVLWLTQFSLFASISIDATG